MSERTRCIVRIGTTAGYVVTVAGGIGLVSFGLALSGGADPDLPGTINHVALVVLVGALGPLMLSFYELGGRTPLRLAQLAQTLGWVSVITFCVVQAAQVTGVAGFDPHDPPSGVFVAASLALAYIGLWIAGANLLAGPWLGWERWPGLVAGLGVVLFAVAFLSGGGDTGWAYLGAIGVLAVLPAWAYLLARRLAARLGGASS